MDEDEVWAAIDHEREALADLLETLADTDWDVPSLCEGWRVRDVAAHVTLSHIPRSRAVLEAIRYRGSFNRMVRETARRHAAEASPQQLIAEIRGMAGSRRHPIGTSHLDPLVDVLVHTQDIAIPLGREHAMPPSAAVAAAGRVWSMGFPFGARRRLRGLRLEAADVAWARGAGEPVRAPIAVLLLLLTGRREAAALRGNAELHE